MFRAQKLGSLSDVGSLVDVSGALATGEGSDTPLLWVSHDRLPDVAKRAEALANDFARTGLWPLALDTLGEVRPWFTKELMYQKPTDPSGVNVKEFLADAWSQSMPSGGDEDEAGWRAPFDREFPGLAAAKKGGADAISYTDLQFTGRLGLIPALRPADVLAAIGWSGPANYDFDMWQFGAVLRSWEDRFGAYVVGVGFDTLTLFVNRPPAGDAALHVAAEHFAICPDNVHQGCGSIEALAESIAGESNWMFWWD
jgi:hypothetical protein